MAPRRGKKAAATAVDESVAAAAANDTEQVNSETNKAVTKKSKVTKGVKSVEQNDVVVSPVKTETKPKNAAPKKKTKQTEPIDTEENGESALPVVITPEVKPKKAASKRNVKQNIDAAAEPEPIEPVNGAAEVAKKSTTRGKKKVESTKVAPKTKSKKAEPETAPAEIADEAGPSKPAKKNTKTKQATEDKKDDAIETTVVPETNMGRGARRKAVSKQPVTVVPVVEQSVETDKPARGRAKKVADTVKSTTKSTKSKPQKKETVDAETADENNEADLVEENNEAESAKGRKRKPAKPIADKSPAKKNKDTVVVDTVDGGSTSKANGTPKKRKIDTKAAADSTTNDASGDELVTKRKKPSKQEAKEQAKSKMNPTANDLSQINFEVDKEFTLKIASWNVAGLRALIQKGGFSYFEHEKPDIICLQEIKCLEEEVPDEAKLKGYHPYWCSTPGGRGGVAILSKSMPYNVEKNIGNEEMDEEGRIITAEYSKFYLVCVYVPNAGRKLVNLDRRLRWNELFKKHLNDLKAKKPVIVCGDMNVAHEEIDLANPKSNRKNAGFSDEERAGMTDLLEDGFIDTFRELYPSQEKAYTFWTYMGNARGKNVGWRLDYSIVSENLKPKIVDSFMRTPVLGSDHCPIVLLMNI